MYKIELTKTARKAYLKLPEKIRKSIYEKLLHLAASPFALNNNIKQLRGTASCYRLRVGDLRVVYQINKNIFLIEVIKIAHRKEVYK